MSNKILIIGNIGSGKSTLAQEISQVYNLQIVSIDDLRIEIGDGSFSKEYLAWSTFLSHCENNDDVILEFSGAGSHKYPIHQSLQNSETNIIVYYLEIEVEVCRERILNKRWNIPYPWENSAIHHLDKIDTELQTDWNNGFWDVFKTFKSKDSEIALSKIREMLK